MPDPLTDAEDYPYGKTDASGQPIQVNEVPLPPTPEAETVEPSSGESGREAGQDQES